MQSDADRWKDGIEDAIRDLRGKAEKREKWQAAVMTAWSMIVFLAGLFSGHIADLAKMAFK